MVYFSQDLENSIRNHSEDRLEKIEELGLELIENEIMAAETTAELKTISDRWHLLQHQVNLSLQLFIIILSTPMYILHAYINAYIYMFDVYLLHEQYSNACNESFFYYLLVVSIFANN